MLNTAIKVLVIEDDEYSRDALAHLLAAEGYHSTSATDGESGLQQARENPPDVIVVDLGLPGIDGKEVIETVRSDNILKSIPILVITAQDINVASSMLKRGANAYLTKPIEFDELTKTISDLYARASVAGTHR